MRILLIHQFYLRSGEGGGSRFNEMVRLWQERGHEVIGCFMRLGRDESMETIEDASGGTGRRDHPRTCADSTVHSAPNQQGCCSVNDAADARLVAAKLGIPFYVLNFRKDFGRIIDYFVGEYNAGRTPNPCVRCNDWLKFGRLFDYAQSIDADHVATGHYARINPRGEANCPGRARLLRGIDRKKDQSYVLFGSPRERLDHMLLPIGELTKVQVRQIAQDLDLPVFDKPDSQEICFVPDNNYADLVNRRSPGQVRPGRIVDTAGRQVGTHEGHQRFTIGQRRGVGLALGRPMYVVDKDARTNTVTVGEKDQLLTDGCAADQSNWLIDPPFGQWLSCQVKVRYNSHPAPARVRATGDDSLEVGFEQAISAVTPGQAVVCYNGDQVLGGGWIRQALH